jgi:hypothetical protein
LSSAVSLPFSPLCKMFIFYSVLLFCSVLFCSVLFCSFLFFSVLFCSFLFCSVLFCSVLFCSLFHSILFYSILFYSILPQIKSATNPLQSRSFLKKRPNFRQVGTLIREARGSPAWRQHLRELKAVSVLRDDDKGTGA